MVELGLKEREGLAELATDDILVRQALAGKCGRVWVPATGAASYCVIKIYHYMYILGVTPKKDRAVSLWGTIARHGEGSYIIPTSESWIDWLVENIDCRYRNFSRYLLQFKGIKNRELLVELNGALEEGLTIDKVKPEEYEALSNDMWSEDFSACFDNSEDFKKDALGYMVYKDNKAVSGCMGRVYSNDFMELVFATNPEYRRRNLALTAASNVSFNLEDNKINPYVDVRNQHSVELASRVGFEFIKEYQVFQIYNSDDEI